MIHSDLFEKVIMREQISISSAKISELSRGDIVTQVGEELVIEDGIIRLRVADASGKVGWVTKDATEADGPVFLEPYYEQPGTWWQSSYSGAGAHMG